mmetsp:Transcript_4289/g.10016  ORF Transcript_4289/g.10016 Transcript_4289/m.10016 type:complete len:471 (+) Transcript_4289:57-1469(+)
MLVQVPVDSNTSVFNQPFNEPQSCFGFCNDASASNNSGPIHQNRSIQKKDGLTEEERKNKKAMDDLLSEALKKLTFEEREEHQEVLHGVNDLVFEDDTFLNSALQELESHLANTKSGSVYEMAESIDAAYVNDKAFRVMFLRANEYDAKSTADQMFRFFDLKNQLFGTDKLVKDITIEDLYEDDIACLKVGWAQLARRDRSGRQVFLQCGGLLLHASPFTIQNILRVQYYYIMKALQSEETQLRGTVSIWYGIGNLKIKSRTGLVERFTAARSLPQKKAAIHVCCDDAQQFVLSSVMVKVMQANMRARVRLHFGSLTECQYQLSTYGIAPQSLPLDAFGNVNLDRHLRWVHSCVMEETLVEFPISSSHALEPITTPNENDVLFTGGKVGKHIGNQRFKSYILEFSQVYDSGTDEIKRHIVNEISAKIHEGGGRFLRRHGAAWEEVPLDNLRGKIMQAFRKCRRVRKQSCV